MDDIYDSSLCSSLPHQGLGRIGYFIWDKGHRQIMKSFIVPRGIAVNAASDADQDDTEFKLSATLGSQTYGICSIKFLDEEF
ncbi:MAG: hypothetical protein NDI69_05460 [Bacteriovoracaceae bacterium]|nr:hypothetical protein [Bacteriovoracaceae bacterium]